MNVMQFIDSRKAAWQQLEGLVQVVKSGTPLSQPDFRKLTLLYRAATSDFAYAGTHFPEHDVHAYLNKLVASCHGVIYQSPRIRFLDIGIWFTRTVPRFFWENKFIFLFTLGLFVLFILVGFFGAEYVPEGEKVFMNFSLLNPTEAFANSADYISFREADIRDGNPFRVYESNNSFYMAGMILTNNIMVALYCFVGGVLAGTITFWSLATTGMMVGAGFHIWWRHGYGWDFWNTVMLHGSIELLMIVMAATCGFMVAGAMLFPGKFKRGYAIKTAGIQSVQIGIVAALWLVLAGIFEGYVTGARLSVANKLLINGLVIANLIFYWVILGWRSAKWQRTLESKKG